MKLSYLLPLSLFFFACDDGFDPTPPVLQIVQGCQPLLGGDDCLLPYPSNFFAQPDASTRTGVRIELTDAAKIQAGATRVDPRLLSTDGASRSPTILALLPDDVSSLGIVGIFDDPNLSVTAESPTLLINTATNEAVPHFVDLDPRATDPKKRAIVIHPLIALDPQTRYVVALHNIKANTGSLAKPATGFALLRDKLAFSNPSLQALTAHYDADIFPVLESFGVSRDKLQLAWDFSTGSKEAPIQDMLRVRELTLAALQQAGPVIEAVTVKDNPDPLTCRIVQGRVLGPLFMDAADDNKSRLLRDANGVVIQNTADVKAFAFTAIIPKSLCDDTTPGRIVGYGHGFFGGQNEVESDKVKRIADRLHAVILAINWEGMALDDGATLLDFLSNDLDNVMTFTDSVHQGMANWMTMSHAMKSQLLQLPEFQRANGDPIYQTTPMNFLGISQGHILGGIMTAVNPDFERMTFNVGGAGLTLMMFRAPPFDTFLTFLETSVSNKLDQQKFAALIQESFDRADPAAYAHLFFEDPPPGTPPDRRILFQTGFGDSTVPNIGSFYHMRLLGLPIMTPTPTSVFGVNEVAGPVDGSAIALYDFGIDIEATYALPDPSAILENDVHESVRQLDAVKDQMDAFFQVNSQIINFCDGVCDPE